VRNRAGGPAGSPDAGQGPPLRGDPDAGDADAVSRPQAGKRGQVRELPPKPPARQAASSGTAEKKSALPEDSSLPSGVVLSDYVGGVSGARGLRGLDGDGGL